MADIDYINAALQERERLRLQQVKEDYRAMQDAGKLSLEDAQESQQIREDIGTRLQKNVPISYEGFQRSVLENPSAMGPNQPGGDYGMPSREDYQKYYVEGQAPPKVTPTYSEFKGQPIWDQRPLENIGLPPYVNQQPQEQIPAAVVEAIGQRQPTAPSRAQRQPTAQQQAPAQPQRPMTIGEQIDMLPFAGDRYEAKRKVMDSAKTQKLNQLNAVADGMMQQGYPFADVKSFLEIKKAQIDANFVVPKPIEETEDFQVAKEALVKGKHAERLFLFAETKQQLEAAKQMKSRDEKVAFLETNLPKLIQSLAAGPDAIQPAEASRIMPELNSVWQNPSQAFELIGRKGIYDAFAKQPDLFIEKLSKLYNATIPAVNERTAFYQDNLGSAFKKLGVGYVTPIGAKNQGIDMTKLQQLREGTQVNQPVFSQTNPADRPASKGPQIVPGMRFGTAVPSSMSYGSKPAELNRPMPQGY
jgi:hypothetical protein